MTLDELINIGTDTSARFIETEILPQLLEAKYDPKKKEELQKLFSPEY